jgi:hypothetical protein
MVEEISGGNRVSDKTPPETFEDFKNSFAYGSRTDLNFKFLKVLSDTDAGDFFQSLWWKLGDSFSDGDIGPLYRHVRDWQARAYAGASNWSYDAGPFALPEKPVAASRLALLTSSGHFVAGHDPQPFGIENMTQEQAAERIDDFVKCEPDLAVIPVGTPREALRVRHAGYDVRAAQADPNVVFPLDRLRELASEAVIGELGPHAYSFVGACAQTRLLRHTGPRWVSKLKEERIDAALLVPA